MRSEDEKKNELIADVYRAGRVYQAEMRSPIYRAEGEADFEFIGKELFRKGYRKIHDDHQKQAFCYTFGCQEGDKIGREVARKIFEEIEKVRMQHTFGNIDGSELNVKLYYLKKKYTEGTNET